MRRFVISTLHQLRMTKLKWMIWAGHISLREEVNFHTKLLSENILKDEVLHGRYA
jgi:hypothetical protein